MFSLVFKNSAILITTRIVTKVATTLLTIYMARTLGDSQFGIFSSVIAFVAFFGLIEEFGLTVPLIRRIARRDKSPGESLGEVVLLKLLLGIPAFLGLTVVARWVDLPLLIVMSFGLNMLFETLNVSVVRSFEGVEKMKNIAIVTLIERTSLCLGGGLVLYNGGGLYGLSLVYIASNLVSLTTGLNLWHKEHQRLHLNLSFDHAKLLLKEALPFAFAGLFSVIYTRLDTLILMSARSSAEIGWYNASYRVTDAQLFVPTAIVASVFPVLSRTFSQSQTEFLGYYRRTFYWLLILGIISGAVTFLFADQIIALFYGSTYKNSVESLRLLSLMVPFYYLNFLTGSALIAIHQEKLSTVTLVVGAIVNTTLNVIFVHQYGQIASSFAKVVSEAFCFIVQVYFFHRFLPFAKTYAA